MIFQEIACWILFSNWKKKKIHKLVNDKHPIDFGGLLKVITEELSIIGVGVWFTDQSWQRGAHPELSRVIGIWG